MNPILAAGLFDSPWVIAAIIIIGAFINWLSQLRQQKQQRDAEQQAREGETETPQKPQDGFDLEESLRRLLGEEAPTPAPPIPRAPSAPPPRVRRGNPPPIIVPPPVAVTLPGGQAMDLNEVRERAARLARVSEQRHQHHASVDRVRRGRWSGLWSDRSSMRRAFVSSLVFGPPKGLES